MSGQTSRRNRPLPGRAVLAIENGGPITRLLYSRAIYHADTGALELLPAHRRLGPWRMPVASAVDYADGTTALQGPVGTRVTLDRA
jgi:hypothetical protein